MDETFERVRRDQSRKSHNDEFLERLFARRPQARQRYEQLAQQPVAVPEVLTEGTLPREEAGLERLTTHEVVAETIVNEERPVLFVRSDWIDRDEVTAIGVEAEELIGDLDARRGILQPLMPLIGRIDVTDFPNADYVGSGWFVDTDVVVTNRHVANLIARRDGRGFTFSRGVAGRPIACSFDTLHEFDDLAVDAARSFAVTEVLYIEPESGPDIAFLRIKRRADGSRPHRIEIAPIDVGENVKVCVIGYPARASRRVIPDQVLMQRLFRDRYDVKRAAPGLTMGPETGATRHDCTTLGGNSGSVVLDLATGQAVGLHFAGLYQETNYAVGATKLTEYVTGKRWYRPTTPEVATSVPPRRPADPQVKPQVKPPVTPQTPAPQNLVAAPAGGTVTITIPLSITLSLGQPVFVAPTATVSVGRADGGGPAAGPNPAEAEAVVRAFWDERPEGVVAARVGFFEEGGAIGDRICIAASAPADRIDALVAQGPSRYRGVPVRYLPADALEQIDGLGIVESVDRIAYDDDVRTGAEFSFEPVQEAMILRAHVGPEYSWTELEHFLTGADDRLVSAMYEFYGEAIKDTIESRLRNGVSLTMVLDNATFSDVRNGDEEFDRIAVFQNWKTRFGERFERVVAPEGTAGLISDAYHIKVAVREDDTFWLSSGNWKQGSSQPVVTDEERENAAKEDLRGNREWHVIVKSPTLARRFRCHILQDFARSRALGGREVPRSREADEVIVEVPVEEAFVLERRPPSRLLKPKQVERSIKMWPLLTPDRQGAVYAEAVLDLIGSARRSLLFQIPYISMPSNPRADRGYIDALIEALTRKLKTLDDARVLLRSGGSKFSTPTHAAWYFKSQGVDIDNRLRAIENHHTKGMIVDGRRVLIGSHNWSRPGVTLNRDASLIIDDADIAGYFAEAFEIDWDRANLIRPRPFVKPEAFADGAGLLPGFRRIPVSQLSKEDD